MLADDEVLPPSPKLSFSLDYLIVYALSQWLMARNPGLIHSSSSTPGSDKETSKHMEQVQDCTMYQRVLGTDYTLLHSIPGGCSPIPIPVADEASSSKYDQWSTSLCQSGYGSGRPTTPSPSGPAVPESFGDNGYINTHTSTIQVGNI